MSPSVMQSLVVGAVLLGSVRAAPIAPTSSQSFISTSARIQTPTTGADSSKAYILLDWDTATPTSTGVRAAELSPSTSASPVLLAPMQISNSTSASGSISTSTTSSASSLSSSASGTQSTASSTSPPSPGFNAADVSVPTKSHWAVPPQFSNMDPFSITSYAAGEQNLAVLRGAPVKWSNSSTNSPSPATPQSGGTGPRGQERWDMDVNAFQLFYPNGSINPGNRPQGGSEFYGQPLDLRSADNVTLQYSVYFPHDFDFVKGGKLPGLYGGHKGCSGGNAAEDCFSTRIMWRQGGKGELYLYVPKDKQTPALCSTPPESICDSSYGLSIGRGAWTFPQGDWTTIRQDIWLNTPGLNDGGFNIWINGEIVMSANDVRYRENAIACGDKLDATSVGPINEDWSSFQAEDAEDVGDTPSASRISSSATFPSFSGSTSSAMSSSISSGISTSAAAVTTSASTTASISASSSYSSHAAHPTFQTPMRRWLKAQRRDSQPSDALHTSTGTSTSTSSSPSATNTASPAPSATPEIKLKQADISEDDRAQNGMSTSAIDSDEDPEVLDQSTTDDTADASAASCGVGFIGLFFSTFFGGHTPDWASPKDQYTYFKDFEMSIN